MLDLASTIQHLSLPTTTTCMTTTLTDHPQPTHWCFHHWWCPHPQRLWQWRLAMVMVPHQWRHHQTTDMACKRFIWPCHIDGDFQDDQQPWHQTPQWDSNDNTTTPLMLTDHEQCPCGTSTQPRWVNKPRPPMIFSYGNQVPCHWQWCGNQTTNNDMWSSFIVVYAMTPMSTPLPTFVLTHPPTDHPQQTTPMDDDPHKWWPGTHKQQPSTTNMAQWRDQDMQWWPHVKTSQQQHTMMSGGHHLYDNKQVIACTVIYLQPRKIMKWNGWVSEWYVSYSILPTLCHSPWDPVLP